MDTIAGMRMNIVAASRRIHRHSLRILFEMGMFDSLFSNFAIAWATEGTGKGSGPTKTIRKKTNPDTRNETNTEQP